MVLIWLNYGVVLIAIISCHYPVTSNTFAKTPSFNSHKPQAVFYSALSCVESNKKIESRLVGSKVFMSSLSLYSLFLHLSNLLPCHCWIFNECTAGSLVDNVTLNEAQTWYTFLLKNPRKRRGFTRITRYMPVKQLDNIWLNSLQRTPGASITLLLLSVVVVNVDTIWYHGLSIGI